MVTLPEELATSELAFFVDWRCRSFYTKPEIGVCTDAEFEVYLVCKEKYPGVDIQVCEQRSLQAQEAAQLALTLKMALPLAFASLCILLAVGVSVHKHYKSYLRNKGMTIDFLDLSYVSARSTGPSGSQDSASMIAGTTSFNVISGKAGSALKLARFRGSQVRMLAQPGFIICGLLISVGSPCYCIYYFLNALPSSGHVNFSTCICEV